MFEAKTANYTIEIPIKFNDINSATKEANCIKIFVMRKGKMKNWSFEIFIGVSENKGNTGKVVYVKASNKGGVKKQFIASSDSIETKVQPHLHILLHAKGANSMAEKIISNIRKRHKDTTGNYSKKKIKNSTHLANVKAYFDGQCIVNRNAEMNVDKL